MSVYYLVSGYHTVLCGANPRWFRRRVYRPSYEGWRTYLSCKTLAHAKRQYRRLPVKDRQIDERGGSKGPRAIMWGRMK